MFQGILTFYLIVIYWHKVTHNIFLYPFELCKLYTNVSSLGSVIDKLFHFFPLLWLKVDQLYWPFQRTRFWSLIFSIIFLISYIWSYLSSVYFRFNFLFLTFFFKRWSWGHWFQFFFSDIYIYFCKLHSTDLAVKNKFW